VVRKVSTREGPAAKSGGQRFEEDDLTKMKEDAIVLEGTVRRALQNAMSSDVELENGHKVLATQLREDGMHAYDPPRRPGQSRSRSTTEPGSIHYRYK